MRKLIIFSMLFLTLTFPLNPLWPKGDDNIITPMDEDEGWASLEIYAVC
ncbi:hypothetical protein KHM83_01415 [Fusibacter paucivorans]|uniref:Uncharacterized protein n=1 Tax=Fusibacter paucivorans TaxID=76009 RepID=A0ABS5PJS0_9FIRM|nr:hypothetical protein [Fusibacter paucivorans]MBS7525329.1 hypothetical protein [Fusibacter paucivorans]